MTNRSLFCAVFAALVLAGIPLQAAIQINASSTGQATTWIGLDDDNPLSIDEDDPVTTLTTIAPGVQSVAAPNSFAVNEQNLGGPPSIGGQSFLATKSGKIQNVQMYIAGSASTFDLHLYNVGAGAPAPTGATTYSSALPDLLPVDTYMRFFGSAGSVHTLDFLASGLDVSLLKGNTYVWEVVGLERDANGVLTGNNTAPTALTWFRNGGNNSYLPNGQAFRSRSSLNGNPDRSFAMALQLPEPAALMLVGPFLFLLGRRVSAVPRKKTALA